MVGADAAVAGDHDPGLLVEGFDVRLDHGLADDAGFGVGGVAFADQADVHVDRADGILLGELFDGVAFVGRIWFEGCDGDVAGAAYVGQGAFDAFRIFVLLVRDQDFDVGVPGVVGVAVGEEIYAAFAGGFDDLDVFGGFVPDAYGA